MTEKATEKFDKVQSKIEKQISPYIKVKISMPDGVDKEAFLKLAEDKAFVDSLQKKAKDFAVKKIGRAYSEHVSLSTATCAGDFHAV